MLTKKEIEILKLRKQGLKQTEIAKKLGVSQPAVSKFENNITRKIEAAKQVLEEIRRIDVKIK